MTQDAYQRYYGHSPACIDGCLGKFRPGRSEGIGHAQEVQVEGSGVCYNRAVQLRNGATDIKARHSGIAGGCQKGGLPPVLFQRLVPKDVFLIVPVQPADRIDQHLIPTDADLSGQTRKTCGGQQDLRAARKIIHAAQRRAERGKIPNRGVVGLCHFLGQFRGDRGAGHQQRKKMPATATYGKIFFGSSNGFAPGPSRLFWI
jgi:hypothetical protein